jgi:RNA polymerase sigma factor (sigma-70 family)
MSKRPPGDVDSTAELVHKARSGDRSAENEIARRSLPELRRWARGRLPASARHIGDTEDLVQETIVRTLRQLRSLDASRPGGLQAYMRRAFKNNVNDQLRRTRARPQREELRDAPDLAPSPESRAVDREFQVLVSTARARLSPRDRALVVAWVDKEWSYARIARALKIPTVNAARMAVHRACARLWKEIYGDAPLPKRRRAGNRRDV